MEERFHLVEFVQAGRMPHANVHPYQQTAQCLGGFGGTHAYVFMVTS